MCYVLTCERATSDVLVRRADVLMDRLVPPHSSRAAIALFVFSDR